MSDNSRLSQCVIVELSDGRTLQFMGKAAVFPDDPPLKIIGIRFTAPAELPDGMYFEEVES